MSPTRFGAFQITLLMPDLVLAVAMDFERDGLGPEPAFDPDSLWRMRVDITVASLPATSRKLRPHGLVVLNARRIGKSRTSHAEESIIGSRDFTILGRAHVNWRCWKRLAAYRSSPAVAF